MNLREQCAQQCRSLFEEAARSNYTGDPGDAGSKLGEAQIALFQCVGITPSFEQGFAEVDRWFSFFGLWWSARLLEQSKASEAWKILTDQAQSYSPKRSKELGILQDYGEQKTGELYQGVMCVLELIQEGNLHQASVETNKVADMQYRLAVEKTGIPAPEPWK